MYVELRKETNVSDAENQSKLSYLIHSFNQFKLAEKWVISPNYKFPIVTVIFIVHFENWET